MRSFKCTLSKLAYSACTAAVLAGCTGWRPEPGGVSAAVAERPHELRITQYDSAQVRMSGPALIGDTLVGRGPKRAETRIPVATIVHVESRQFDAPRTMALVGGIGLATVVGILAAQASVENALGDAWGQ